MQRPTRSSPPGSSRPTTGTSGRRSALRAAVGAALLSTAVPAWGFYNDRFELFFTETVTWDDNVFRLSDRVDTQAALGRSTRSDRVHMHGVGLSTLLPVGLQRFEASYQRFWTRYQRFTHLDFEGDAWRALWAWAIGREFYGDLGYTQTEGLASFAAFGGTTRDVVTTRQAYASGNWMMTPRWIAYGGLNATERKHGDRSRRAQDIEAVSAEGRLTYVTPKENRIGVAVRFEDGGAPERVLLQGIPFDNAYRQWGAGVVGRWDITAHSRLDGRADYVRRKYDQFSDRDYSGPSWGVTYTWNPTVKITVPVTIRRDIAPLEEVQTSFVLATGIGVKPRWQVTEKLALLGSLDYLRWKYRGDPAIGAGDFEHRVKAGLVGFAWTPLQRVVITGSVQREVRRSDVGGADYEVTLGTLDARVGF